MRTFNIAPLCWMIIGALCASTYLMQFSTEFEAQGTKGHLARKAWALAVSAERFPDDNPYVACDGDEYFDSHVVDACALILFNNWAADEIKTNRFKNDDPLDEHIEPNLIQILVVHGIHTALNSPKGDEDQTSWPLPDLDASERLCELFDVAQWEVIDRTIDIGLENVDYCF